MSTPSGKPGNPLDLSAYESRRARDGSPRDHILPRIKLIRFVPLRTKASARACWHGAETCRPLDIYDHGSFFPCDSHGRMTLKAPGK